MSTRLNDPKTDAKVIVMQRVHECDLSGHVLAQGGYEHLCLPAEYEGSKRRTSIGWCDPRNEPEELLRPERFGRQEIEELKHSMGSYAAAGQLQQRAAPAEGRHPEAKLVEAARTASASLTPARARTPRRPRSRIPPRAQPIFPVRLR